MILPIPPVIPVMPQIRLCDVGRRPRSADRVHVFQQPLLGERGGRDRGVKVEQGLRHRPVGGLRETHREDAGGEGEGTEDREGEGRGMAVLSSQRVGVKRRGEGTEDGEEGEGRPVITQS